MNAAWQSFLEGQGATVDGGVVWHYGDAASELAAASRSAVISDLSPLGVISIHGDDALSFLQGQLSCDVSAVAINASTYGSYCTAKGRVLATFLLWRGDSGFFMALPRDVLATIQKRLTMFVLRAKVKLADVSSELVLLGLSFAEGGGALAGHFDAVPAEIHRGVREQNGLLLRVSETRLLWIGDATAATRIWAGLASASKPVGAAAWSWLDIRAGLAWITQATQEQFVPQMINLELIGGVSFQKGCYPGQEIVARTQYLGKLKRRMYLASMAATDAIPAPGTELFSDDLGEQVSGMVVSAQPSPTGGFDLLAVTQTSSVEASVVHLGSPQGPALAFQALPYSLA